MRFLLHIAYKGSRYNGWQRQKDVLGIQEVLETTLSKMLGKTVHCMGCGRTDTGVHASQYFCHLDLDENPDFDFIFRINKMLPDDIAVFQLIPVEDRFHAQHFAVLRTYDYYLHFEYDPFLAELSYFHPNKKLDFASMRQLLNLTKGEHDFRAFCKSPAVYKSTICKIKEAKMLLNKDHSILKISITSDRFLRSMVRLIVGNLIETGEGTLKPEQFKESLMSGTPLPYFKAAYPQGLYLAGVGYPGLDIPVRATWNSRFLFRGSH